MGLRLHGAQQAFSLHPHSCSASIDRTHTWAGPESQPDTIVWLARKDTPQTPVCTGSWRKPIVCGSYPRSLCYVRICWSKSPPQHGTQGEPQESAHIPRRHESQESCSAVRASSSTTPGLGQSTHPAHVHTVVGIQSRKHPGPRPAGTPEHLEQTPLEPAGAGYEEGCKDLRSS